jgi:hypothetical protein
MYEALHILIGSISGVLSTERDIHSSKPRIRVSAAVQAVVNGILQDTEHLANNPTDSHSTSAEQILSLIVSEVVVLLCQKHLRERHCQTWNIDVLFSASCHSLFCNSAGFWRVHSCSRSNIVDPT